MQEMLTNFHLLRPYWLLLAIPLVLLLVVRAQHRLRTGGWSSVCDEKLLPYVMVPQRQVRSMRGLLATGVCGLIGIIALAGPVWQQLPQPIFSSDSALVIALDLSHSMDVQDIKPSRLTRAKHKILDILNKRHEGQTALVVYAAESFVVSPLTDDTNTIATLAKDLTSDLMPTQGSYPEKAVYRAMELFKQSSVVNGHVLLITDGIDSSGMNAALRDLTAAGFSLSILGVGTEQGAPIADYNGGFVKDRNGAIVVARLNEQQVASVAAQGHGIYRTISADDRDIDDLLRVISTSRLSDKFNRQQNELKVHSDQWREEGPWLLLLLLPLTALAFRRGYLVLLLMVMLPVSQPSQAFEWASLWQTPDQRAQHAMQSGDSKSAAELFKDPQWKAAANFRAGNYQQSVDVLQHLNTPDDLYNKATAQAKLGQLQQAIDTYNNVLKLDPQHADAKYNRDLLQDYLKKQQQNQQQSQQDSQQKDQQQDQQQGQQNSSQQQSAQQDKDEGKNSQQQQSKQNQSSNGSSQDQASQNQNAQSQQDQSDQTKPSQQAQDQAKQQQNQNSTSQNSEKQDTAQRSSPSDKKDQPEQDSSAQTAKDVQQLQQEMEKQRQLASQQKQPEQPDNHGAAQNAVPLQETEAEREAEQKTEQWLRRIPDDPGGLLRRKFQMQSRINPRQAQGEQQPW